jgi:hypothetical protein
LRVGLRLRGAENGFAVVREQPREKFSVTE